MNPLAHTQQQLMACLLDAESKMPSGWTSRHAAGLDIYRNNFRSATFEALRNAFARTCRVAGETSFARAAIHHLITCPPHTWTLDDVGEGFAATCATLFGKDPEVAELAWLEWAMHRAFSAEDSQPLPPAAFAAATATYTGEQWCALRLTLAPAVTVKVTDCDLAALWQATAVDDTPPESAALAEPLAVIVWREAERPLFRLAPAYESAALKALLAGETYADVCAIVCQALGDARAPTAAGAMLIRWLEDGLVEAIRE